MTRPRKLLLWDIDGTLTSTSNAGKRALIRTIGDVQGIETALEEIDIRGSSDQRIVRELFTHHKIPGQESGIQAFFQSYFKILAEELPKGKVTLHPGIEKILKRVSERSDLAQGLLTGNMARGAQLKLEHAGIWNYFPFGAFGNDSADRNQLGPFALRRAKEKLGVDFIPENVFIIGDTPHDIACARAIKAKVIAVATGGHTVEELETCKPDAVFKNLEDGEAFFRVLDQ